MSAPALLAAAAVLLALLGVPLFAVLAFAGLGAFSLAGVDPAAVAVEIYRMASWPTLVSVPLFTFAGHLMAAGGSPGRILALADAALGWVPGGRAVAALAACAFFTAFTGASGVTIVALGGLLLPVLRDAGHSERFSLGLVTTSGSLGLLFPPSLPIILYGLVARVDVDRLFLAALVPGLLLLAVLSLWSVADGRRSGRRWAGGRRARRPFDGRRLAAALRTGAWEALLPVGVLGGIYGGFVTVVEAAALTALYVLAVGTLVHGDLRLSRDVPRIAAESMALVGAVLLILAAAMGLTNVLIDEQVPERLWAWAAPMVAGKAAFLLCLNVFLLLVGAMMDVFSAIVVVVPLVLPIAEEFGVHPLHLAVIVLANLEIGFITPPVGVNLFIAGLRFGVPVTTLYRAVLPWFLLLLASLLAITYAPWLSLAWEGG